MVGIIALVVGLLGMFGLWAVAWQIWGHDMAIPSAAPSGWRNEPTPPGMSTEIVGAPVVRPHPNSGANTTFYSRGDLSGITETKVEKTEILHDDDIVEEPTRAKDPRPIADPPPATGTRKTKPYPPPPGALQ